MKIIYMGTPGFAVPPLRRLLGSTHEVVAVVTKPDQPVGRGQLLTPPPVKELALEHHVPMLQPEKLRGQKYDQVLKFYGADCIVVAAYGHILPPEILELPRFGCINIHASLLPRYRGAAPIQWAVANGERHTGVTIMQMERGLDTGPIIAMESVEILDDDDAHSITNMLSVIGGELLLKCLGEIERAGAVVSKPQEEKLATHAPMLKKSDGLLDWSRTTEQVLCRVRGMKPWPGAFSYYEGKAWRIEAADPYLDETGLFKHLEEERLAEPGRVCALLKGKGPVVRTGDGYILIQSAQPAGKRAMSGVDLINGKMLQCDQSFISDEKFLEGERG